MLDIIGEKRKDELELWGRNDIRFLYDVHDAVSEYGRVLHIVLEDGAIHDLFNGRYRVIVQN
jgi:hypothetical protein